MLKRLQSQKDIADYNDIKDRLFSATHEEITAGWTTDIYFLKTRDVLKAAGLLETPVVAEVFARKGGMFAGSEEVIRLFKTFPKTPQVETLREGTKFEPKEVLMRITGTYESFGTYETVLLGMLASSTGWATAAAECVEAAEGRSVLCFGARHVHPAIASVMERAAKVAGCSAMSCILAAKLCGEEPKGTVPHAAVLLMGDTVKLAKFYDEFVPAEEPRTILVDTFKDEAEETIRVAEALGDRLASIRLDTPGERGGVTPDLVREIRWRLDCAGYPNVKIVATGGLSPERIKILNEAGADVYGVGSYITQGTPRDMTMDIKMVNGKPIAKRGRLPGIIPNPKLERVL
ncbi:MAG: nicotinate phosphoribosyltransferase [Synergistaceae bacterium]|nr:nicotinate phosphoribosyltransferase [Synergistaceae bacterium]